MSISANLFRNLYSLLLTALLPFLFLRLLWRSRKNSLYRERWLERLGIHKTRPKPQGIWCHAVSAGESIAAVPLIKAIKKQFPNCDITVTTTTPTGAVRIQQMLGNEVYHVYFPFDLPFAMNNFLKRIQPKLCLLMETELWPNCLNQLQKHRIPVMIVNARLSEKSMLGYQRIQSVVKQMLLSVTQVAAQSLKDGERFIQLGLPKERMQMTGNIKFDLQMPANVKEDALKLKQLWGNERKVWIAASTHQGEEEEVLKAFQMLRQKYPETLLILVPRHVERKSSIIPLIKQYNLSYVERSQSQIPQPTTQVFLIDTMGEMPLFYQASDVAFVGGSFVPVGGHNTLEPAAVCVPVIVGPHVHNFVEITDYLFKAGALMQVNNANELYQKVRYWFDNEKARACAGLRGKEVVEQNRGAVAKTVGLIQHYI